MAILLNILRKKPIGGMSILTGRAVFMMRPSDLAKLLPWRIDVFTRWMLALSGFLILMVHACGCKTAEWSLILFIKLFTSNR